MREHELSQSLVTTSAPGFYSLSWEAGIQPALIDLSQAVLVERPHLRYSLRYLNPGPWVHVLLLEDGHDTDPFTTTKGD